MSGWKGFNLNEKHEIRVLLAPLSYSETSVITSPINFAGELFNANEPLQADYTFNSRRVGYRYHWRAREHWDIWLGGTLKVRDAEIRLSEGALSSFDDDLGIVPLFHVAGEYRFDGPWIISADRDTLGGGPGRAIDLGVNLHYTLTDNWDAGFEYRALEGGADIEALYNFAWFKSLLLTARYRP